MKGNTAMGILARILNVRRATAAGGDVLSCANAMLDLMEAEGRQADLLRLQRLLVLAQGWSIALGRKRLFEDEIGLAFGTPYIAAVHKAFRSFGTGPITGRAACRWMADFDQPAETDDERLRVMEAVEHAYRRLSSNTLGSMLRTMLGDHKELWSHLDPDTLAAALRPSIPVTTLEKAAA